MQNSFSRVLIKDTSNKILIIQDRAEVWNFPGGKQELNETPLECAKREVKEEIGLQVDDLTEIYQGNFCFGDTQWQGYFYFANSVSGIPFINELDKIKEIRFINRFEVIKFPLELTEIIQQMLESPQFQTKLTNWK
ncbi:NUDIX hydrolase [Bacillus wiedmannii]|uniref:NUDIX hydrolase n=1 Tax=Bacillus wiedmannii TaxID=1890302 RepID=UPI000BF0BFA8|nr:NUDIX hydrolase [Bacillus wiedmannii]MED3318672.1 NUDIX hydrolase [Bacillus wiedmannii]PEJ33501.1 NUDIX domain-containing protein [Bacillus wiedmannii]PEU19968.1 NUDIX domain-containing protein [Bacillus wiedmannii]PGD49813.1 NUDIX domain-containing protein [Bacillus wiedmannii]PHB13005.1 NUDIX domain-containing protein [Bacillus wiedmannii]